MPENKTPSVPLSYLLGFNAGYVDTAGFLALNGLFAAHVTGNFVTLGAALIHGSTGAISKLLALPVFCLAVALTRLVSNALVSRQRGPMHSLIVAQVLLLAVAATLMLVFGPFADSDALPAFVAGMLMVVAMAVQNAMQRMHLSHLPPSTLMTGNTTQVMIDLADRIKGLGDASSSGRLRKMLPAIASFAAGCALAALAYVVLGMWCFVLPPVIAVWSAVAVRRSEQSSR